MILPQTPKEALQLVLYREARSLGLVGMFAVGCVIANRVEHNKTNLITEIYKKWQFSSMSDPDDPQLHAEPTEEQFYIAAGHVADVIISGSYRDSTLGATMYYSDYIPKPNWNWAELAHTITIGNTLFYKLI